LYKLKKKSKIKKLSDLSMILLKRFERGKLNDLIDVFPEYSNELREIINRLKDLMIPFQQKWYYTPKMKGSYSIKYVLPALVPELSYNDLEIKEGGE